MKYESGFFQHGNRNTTKQVASLRPALLKGVLGLEIIEVIRGDNNNISVTQRNEKIKGFGEQNSFVFIYQNKSDVKVI